MYGETRLVKHFKKGDIVRHFLYSLNNLDLVF